MRRLSSTPGDAHDTDLFDLSSLASGLDVFEVNVGVLGKVYDRSQEVEQSFVRFERLEDLDQRRLRQLLVIFRRNLHADLHAGGERETVRGGRVGEVWKRRGRCGKE